MAYQDNRRTSKHYPRDNKEDNIFKEIVKPLHEYYNNPVELYLPGGKAEVFAATFIRIKNHQMRKILDEVKNILLISNTNFEEARKRMFVIVAMCAYNAGRIKDTEILYNFVKSHINVNSIISIKDIETFDQLFTSIVAYHTNKTKNANR